MKHDPDAKPMNSHAERQIGCREGGNINPRITYACGDLETENKELRARVKALEAERNELRARIDGAAAILEVKL